MVIGFAMGSSGGPGTATDAAARPAPTVTVTSPGATTTATVTAKSTATATVKAPPPAPEAAIKEGVRTVGRDIKPGTYTTVDEVPRDRHRGVGASGHTFGYSGAVATMVPLSEAKDHLSEYVSEVARTHDRVVITRHGQPTAMLISVEDIEGLEETLDILSTPGEYEAIQEGLGQADRGEFVDTDALQKRHGFRG